jgi:dihydrofolate reductase
MTHTQELKEMYLLAINLIVCMDKNGTIGKGNSLPWSIPEDMKYFRKTTLNHCVVMGRNTYESIPKKLDKRACFILSTQDFTPKWGTKLYSISQFMGWSKYYQFHNMDTFVIGGAQIYEQFYPWVDKLYITYVNDIYEGDVKFPIGFSQINEDFELESRKIGDQCEFVVMRRKYEEN